MNRGEVTVTAPAKINLSLGVGAVRGDGFHPLATVYQAIGLYDEVRVRPADDWAVTVHGRGRLSVDQVPTDGSNLALRAARALADLHGRDEPVRLTVTKGIPVAGGLAGGSADAAAALVACDALWGTGTAREELLGVAADLGSDVPFLLLGGTAVGSGRGELVAPVQTRGTYWWVVLESPTGLSTPQVYRELDHLRAGAPVPDPEVPEELLTALSAGDVERLGGALTNDLQPAALRLRPELSRALARGLEESALGAMVSGSGPTCVFLCASGGHAEQVAAGLGRHGLGPVRCVKGPVPGARIIG